MSVIGSSILAGASGSAGGESKVYVDDVFSTFLIEGNSSSGRAINNGIDLAGEGGLVWTKQRDGTRSHYLFDTENSGYALSSDLTSSKVSASNRLTAFNNNGFTLGSDSDVNKTSSSYASWTFRKAPGFFDIVTYSGNDTARAIPHNLGSVPGMIIVKKINDSGGWYTYHRSAGNTKWLNLASSNDASTVNLWNNQTPTASEFYLSSNQNPNGTGYQYVAYIFAHDEPVFGTDEDESIIKCGSYSGNDNAPHTIDVGFEPQFVMIKNIDSNASNWIIADMMRTKNLKPNTSEVESHPGTITYTSSGFTINNNNIFSNALDDYIYMAIRRPNKPPTAGTEVFDIKTSSSDGGSGTLTSDTVLADMVWSRGLEASRNGIAFDRLTRQLQILNSTGGMAAASWYTTDHQTGFLHAGYWATNDIVDYTFKRTPGFFDVVTYTGNSGANTIYHNLSAVPELFFLKNRSGGSLRVEIVANHDAGNTTSSGSFSFAEYFNTGITDSYVSTTNVGTSVNANGGLYLLYLFATLPGISKIGTYSGNTGYAINVPCGFTNGARFIMIKRTNGTGDWYVWDSVRGIIGGNDPYFLLNSTAIEVTNTDYIDPLSTGFTVTASAPAALNVTGGTYLFLAIA